MVCNLKVVTRKHWVRHKDLNAHQTLFGGTLMSWIDEDAALHLIDACKETGFVTAFIGEMQFVSPARLGDLVDVTTHVTAVGTSSITLGAKVFNSTTGDMLCQVSKIVFVAVDAKGNRREHDKFTDDFR